ncbi:hypothetical protein LTS15_007602 [Exophiala xenobiotica]|nr:hypothetical protein LTS15_007602 [Exophiala xenobiotica]
MLSYAKAQQKAAGKPEEEAKVWYYALSYGSVLGSTFAALYPESVGRMVLDGVLDGQDYFNGACKSSPKNCSFWGPSPQNITARLDDILSTLQSHPVPVTGLDGGSEPGLATYTDLKQLLLWVVYAPIQRFPLLADALVALENGDGSQVMSGLENVVEAKDVESIVKCVDGYRGTARIMSPSSRIRAIPRLSPALLAKETDGNNACYCFRRDEGTT